MKHPILSAEIAWAEREKRRKDDFREGGFRGENRRETARNDGTSEFRRFYLFKTSKLQRLQTKLQLNHD